MSPPTRLFSNLSLERNQLSHRPGNVLGSTALVAGTTVGAGILALPAVTFPAGVVPSTVMLISIWLYAALSGLLLAEVSVNTMGRLGRPHSGMLSMVETTLGKVLGRIAAVAYLFLHYALLVAYIARGGEILCNSAASLTHTPLPQWAGPLTFVLIFGSLLYFGRQRLVEQFNNVLVVLVIVSFIGLIGLGTSQIDFTSFSFQNWGTLPKAIPVMFVALFYQNIVPAIATQLEGDIRKIRQSIFFGSVIPLLMFLVWNAVILGNVSLEMAEEIQQGQRNFDPLQILHLAEGGGRGGGYLLLSIFSEFAIVTSFIGFVYALLHFFQDLWPPSPQEKERRWPLYSLVLLPSLSLSTLNPNIFLTALDYAGSFSISLLSGILPSLMAWRIRYQWPATEVMPVSLVRGGKVLLILMMGIALAAIVQKAIDL